MSEEKPDPFKLVARIQRMAEKSGQRVIPPVESWNPDYCGEMELVIKRDGSWHYRNSPIGRKAMVDLFATILRHDDDGHYYLVTPVEKCRIEVEDAPFIAIDVEIEGQGREQVLCFTTNVGDVVTAGADHPLRVELDPATREPRPYLHVRAALEALVHRNVFYRLVEIGVPETVDGEDWLGVWSAGRFFPIDRV